MTDFLPPVVLRLAADISDYTEKLAAASAQLEAFTQGASTRLDETTSHFGEEGESAGQAFTQGVSTHLEEATSRFREEGDRAGKSYSEGIPAHVTEAGERAVRDATGRLRDGRGRFVTEGEEAARAVSGGLLSTLGSMASELGSVMGSLASNVGSAFSTVGSVAGGAFSFLSSSAMPALIAAASQLIPVLASVGGALAGAIPAAATTAVGSLLTLMLGFHALSSAIGAVFAPAAGGGAAAMGQVANAEWNLKQAQQQSIQTQQALNQARVAAVQNIKDLALAMSGAKLHVEEAQLAVKDADLAWRQAFASGNQDQIYRTSLALQQAQQNLAEAQNSADKTAAQKADSDQRGVEGSQGVQSALHAQEQAVHSLEQAQQALTQAQKGAGGAASALSTALAALAPSAREVVLEIKRLAPALHDIQQTVQQHMFAGLAGDLANLAHAWLPEAKAGLVGLSDQFNLMFRGVAQGLATPAFTGALTTVFASFKSVLGDFAALAPKAVGAFGQLVSAATPFLEKIGHAGAGGLGALLDWINKIAANGQLKAFFDTASQALSAFGPLLKDVGTIISAIFTAISGAGGPALGVLGTLIHSIAEFFGSTQGGLALAAIFQTIAPLLGLLADVIGQVLPIAGQLLAVLGPALQPIIAALGPVLKPVVDLIGKIGSALTPIIEALAPALTAVLVALTPVLDMLGGALGDIIVAMAPVIAELATVIGQVLVMALQALMPVFTSLLPVIVMLVQAALPPLIPLIQLIGQIFAALMPILVPLINLLVDILVPVLKLLVPVINMLTPAIEAVAKMLLWIITPISDFIGWLVKGLDKASTWKAIGHWFADLWHDISDAFSKGVKWIGQKWDEFIGFITGLPHRVTDAIGDFGSLLWNKGQDLIRGLWDGIKAMGGWLKDKIIGWVKDTIPKPIADILGIKSPSTVAAGISKWVPIGLAKGMDDHSGHVVAASRRLADAMLPGVGGIGGLGLPTFGGSSGGFSAPLPPVGTGQPATTIIEVHVHSQVDLDGKRLHEGLIGPAQRYKTRTGTTGLG